VEFAIVLPVLLLLVLGIFDLGRYFIARAKVRTALAVATEFGAAQDQGCIASAEARLEARLAAERFAGDVQLSGAVLTLGSGVRVLRLAASGTYRDWFLPIPPFPVRGIAVAPIENPAGCPE
jgi:Flp pilus assembly protein TadG